MGLKRWNMIFFVSLFVSLLGGGEQQSAEGSGFNDVSSGLCLRPENHCCDWRLPWC